MSVPLQRRRDAGYRRDTLWVAAMLHRLSGVLLALFLPVHFLVLGLAIEGEARLDGFLRWTESPAVKLAEAGLLFLLGVHLIGGLRVLLVETLGWHTSQKRAATAAIVLAGALAMLFLLLVI